MTCDRDYIPWEVVELPEGCLIRGYNGRETWYPCLYYLDKEVAEHIVERHNKHAEAKEQHSRDH